uniref:mRNA cap 0 methyltransferase domain-containing protein n=1 Tax=viral metagenome TaxID=1070528 RepID=A0A6C0J5S5_9ZZZZ
MLTSNEKQSISKLFNNIEKNDEFEIMFNNYKNDNKLSLTTFIKVMKYLKFRSTNEKLKLYESTILDIINPIDNTSVYRISIKNIDDINKVLSLVYHKKNDDIFLFLIEHYSDNEHFEFIKKIKDKNKIFDLNSYDIRFRVAVENNLELKKIKKEEIHNESIVFRYKQRLTLEITKDLVVDLTMIKTSNDINKINNTNSTYELEIDYSPKSKKIGLDLILDEMIKIKKLIENTEIIISTQESKKIIDNYKSLVYDRNKNINNLYSMQPISAEVQHIVDNIPNVYSVTDKADGDKYQLFIHNNETFLIENNLNIKKININISNVGSSIFEGELIYLPKVKKHIFMLFDCFYYNNKDLRNEQLLEKRIEKIYELCDKIPNSKPYKVKPFDGTYSISKQKEHYQKEIELYFNDLNKKIDNLKDTTLLIFPKLFLFPLGGNNSEVYLFSSLIWNNCTNNQKVNCPYELDGIIYTGIKQKYKKDRKEHQYPIYKYKPPHTNSLDVFIKFEMNKDTGKYMDIFDNSIPSTFKNKEFRVTNLFVGGVSNGFEVPIPFMPEINNDQIYLPIVNGQVRDLEGNIIIDNTVIEIVYNNNSIVPHQYRWSVLKTRWDKTESVNKYKKKYGNFSDFAVRIWKSMTEDVTIEEINNLAIPENYTSQKKILSSRLTSSVISTQKQQDAYYQKTTNLCKKMRSFNNFIKSIIFYTYCVPKKLEKGGKIIRQSILDIGCGRGGDLAKMYHSKVGEYVGIDPDLTGIYSSSDGAIARYNFFRNKFPNFPKTTFLHADARGKFDAESQIKILNNTSDENKKALGKIFTKEKKFDIISAQFSIHFVCDSDISINNFDYNIKSYLKKDGYFIFTIFDSNLVNNLFDKSNKYTSYYTTDEGERKVLYEIVKKYTDEQYKNKLCNPIDVHMSWINNENKYIEESLLSKDKLINKVKSMGMELVDTDLFSNLYYLNKPFFKDVIQFEANEKNKQFYQTVGEFFGNLKGEDKESRDWAFLYRYYIFRKTE